MRNLIRWEPFRSIRRWDPLDELHTMQYEMDRLFNRVFGSAIPLDRPDAGWTPSIESYVKEGKLILRAELPGVEQKDLDVSINGRSLVIKGEKRQEHESKEKHFEYREIAYGSFERHYQLSEGVKAEELKAKFHNGVLEVTVPAPAVSKARKIEIESSQEEKKLIESEGKKAA